MTVAEHGLPLATFRHSERRVETDSYEVSSRLVSVGSHEPPTAHGRLKHAGLLDEAAPPPRTCDKHIPCHYDSLCFVAMGNLFGFESSAIL